MPAKLCIDCFRKYFGPKCKVTTLTWGSQCGVCHKPTPSLSTLVKCDWVADMAVYVPPPMPARTTPAPLPADLRKPSGQTPKRSP